VAIDGIFWGLVALIDVALWLAETTRQFMARDAHAITLSAFAQTREPLPPEFLALAPAAVPLALPSMVGLLMPMSLRSSINSNNSVRRWLAAALPLVVAPVAEDAPVVTSGKTPRKTRNMTNKTDTTKSLRKRSHKEAAAAL
jgi:hypothetical protein